MGEVVQKEVVRLEAEEKMAQLIANNAGKALGYFQVPS